MTSQLLWLALSHLKGYGPVAQRQLVTQQGTIDAAWDSLGSNLETNQALDWAKREFEQSQKYNSDILAPDDTNYPTWLNQIPSSPTILYVQGNILPKDAKSVAVVGSRGMTEYGKEITQTLTKGLVSANVTIISGLALGVDQAAHTQALSQNGRTLAVVGQSLEQLLSPKQASLKAKIIQNGAVISQFPFGTVGQSFTFPARNALIAALSQAVVVTEARLQSGALITAQEAFKMQKPVFAVPGSIFAVGSGGCHQLIRQGAQLAVDATAILETLGWDHPIMASPANTNFTASEHHLLALLEDGQQHIDQLIRASGMPPAEVSTVLVSLELQGVVSQNRDGQVRRIV